MLKKIIIPLFILSFLILPQKSNAENHQLGNWYFGLGLGTGLDARYQRKDQYTITFDEAMDAYGFRKSAKMTANLKAGIRIYPRTLLGIDYSTVQQEGTQDTGSGKTEYSLQINNYFLMFTHFFSGENYFVRAGGGRSDFIAKLTAPSVTGASRIHGYGALVGVGYIFWVGDSLNVSFNLDYSRQFYSGHKGEPDGSSFTALYFGFGIN